MRKCDYLKGVTQGLKMKPRFTHYRSYSPNTQHDADRAMRGAQDKYQGDLLQSCPDNPEWKSASYGTREHESQAHIRATYYWEGIQDAFNYGGAQTFCVTHYRGNASYGIADLAEYRVYVDPSEASLRALVKNYHDALASLVNQWRKKNIPAYLKSNFDNLFGPRHGDWGEFRSKAGNITPKLAAKRIDHFLKTGR